MTELIDKKQLLSLAHDYNIDGCSTKAIKVSDIESLESIDKPAQDNWINISDELPEIGLNVLICKKEHVGHAKRVNSDYFTIIASNDRVHIGQIEVWSELPIPPTQGEEFNDIPEFTGF